MAPERVTIGLLSIGLLLIAGCGNGLARCSESELDEQTFLTAEPTFIPEVVAAGDPLTLRLELKNSGDPVTLLGGASAEGGGPSGALFTWSGQRGDTLAEIPIGTDDLEAGVYLLDFLQDGPELPLGGEFATYVEHGSMTYEFTYVLGLDSPQRCDSKIAVARFTVTP